jgi:hypothetical protein
MSSPSMVSVAWLVALVQKYAGGLNAFYTSNLGYFLSNDYNVILFSLRSSMQILFPMAPVVFRSVGGPSHLKKAWKWVGFHTYF